jgi:predicted transcriptional regulator
MATKSDAPTFSIYIPKSKMEQQPLERLGKLSKQRDRSVNYLVMEAILEYLDREERRETRRAPG